MNDCTTIGVTYWAANVDSVTNKPNVYDMYNWVMWVRRQGTNIRRIQYLHSVNTGALYFREYDGGTWSAWKEISHDIPTFYKNYNDLSSLASALGVLNIKSALDVTSGMNQAWVDAMEESFQATGSSKTWFQGYHQAAQECAWFGYRTYQNWATIICIVGYNNETNLLCKGCRDNEGNWTFYKFVGGL